MLQKQKNKDLIRVWLTTQDWTKFSTNGFVCIFSHNSIRQFYPVVDYHNKLKPFCQLKWYLSSCKWQKHFHSCQFLPRLSPFSGMRSTVQQADTRPWRTGHILPPFCVRVEISQNLLSVKVVILFVMRKTRLQNNVLRSKSVKMDDAISYFTIYQSSFTSVRNFFRKWVE